MCRQIPLEVLILLREDTKTPLGNNLTNYEMNTHIRILFIFLVIFGIAGSVVALTKDDVVFPVTVLGNCQNEQECRSFCDDPDNITECVAFAEKYSLLSESEIEKAKKFQDIGGVGPGGCTSEKACEAYCENVSNIEECLAFAEQSGFMEQGELEEARRVATALRQGAQLPGGCTGKDSCEEYCSDSSHMKECVEFAEKAGFMSAEELKEAKQVLKALDAGVSFPGNCKGKNECDAYCQDSSHMEECVNFGIAAGFIPPEEAEQVRKMLPLMKSGKMPGACREGKQECEAYCGQEENIEECTTFFTEAGFMTQEEAQMFKKTGGKGPGSCKGKEECEAFCNNPENQQACFEFAKEHGLIPEEDLQRMEDGVAQFREGFQQAPPEVAECLKQRVGVDVLQRVEAGNLMPNQELGDHMRSCFEEFMPRPQEGSFEKGDQGFPGEQADCVERILGDSRERSGSPTPEQEQQLRDECFGQTTQQFSPPQQFEGEHLQGEFEEGFKQEFQREFDRQFQEQFQQQQGDGRAAACAEEGGVWDGTGCRAPRGAQGVFPEGEPQYDESFQFQQEQIQRQVQQQQLEQQIQQQFEQLQQLQQLQQEQTPPPPISTGGSILDAAAYFLRQLIPKR